MVRTPGYNHVFYVNDDEVPINEMFEMSNMYNDISCSKKYVVFGNDNPIHGLYWFEMNNIYMNTSDIDERFDCV